MIEDAENMIAATAFPSLSITVNNYNYARYLDVALDSVLDQMIEGDELIVVDDGSTDTSSDVLQTYANKPGVILIKQENAGQVIAVRTGMEAATGDVLLLLDSDDYFLPGYLCRLRQIYSQQPEVSMVFSPPQLFGEDKALVEEMRQTLDGISYDGGLLSPTKWATLLFFEFVGTPTSGISMRRDLAQKMLLLPERVDGEHKHNGFIRSLFGVPLHRVGHTSTDGILVRCASVLDATRYLDSEPGFAYRIHGKNKFAAMPRRGQLYVRSLRKKSVTSAFRQTYELPHWPTAAELKKEIQQRPWPRKKFRRLTIRLRYAYYAIRSRGGWKEKTAALLAAAGRSPATAPE